MATSLSFDPKTVPVQAIDLHLPKPLASSLTAAAIAARFARAHAWEPEVRKEARFVDRAPAHASVLIPLVLRERLTVLLTLRPTHMSSHSGQIAFPGGKADPEDQDAVATALREAEEEVGLEPQYVQVLGSLPIYATGSA